MSDTPRKPSRYHEGPFSAELEARGMPIQDGWRPQQATINALLRLGFDKYTINGELRQQFIQTMRRNDARNEDWDTLFEDFATLQQSPQTMATPRGKALSTGDTNHPASTSRYVRMDDNWRPSDEMAELILTTICDKADYLNAQLISFTSHFHGQQHPNWDQKFKQWINNGWNVYGHKKNFDSKNKDDRGFVEKHTDKSWRDGL